MRNIKLTIAYDGAYYKGWQVQPNGWTVQAEVEQAIEKVFGKKYRVHGAGRTDTGVHAKAQVAHFKLPADMSIEKITPALNSAMTESVVVIRAENPARLLQRGSMLYQNITGIISLIRLTGTRSVTSIPGGFRTSLTSL